MYVSVSHVYLKKTRSVRLRPATSSLCPPRNKFYFNQACRRPASLFLALSHTHTVRQDSNADATTTTSPRVSYSPLFHLAMSSSFTRRSVGPGLEAWEFAMLACHFGSYVYRLASTPCAMCVSEDGSSYNFCMMMMSLRCKEPRPTKDTICWEKDCSIFFSPEYGLEDPDPLR